MLETTLSKDDERITRMDIAMHEPNGMFGFEATDSESKAFFHLCDAILQCGRAARSNQRLIHRSFKEDGSILTETDLAVSNALLPAIGRLYPGCNIVTEEVDLRSFDCNAPLTFILDPIDGTDAYSQGFPSWCIALGILDASRKPCGGIIYAPRFGIGEDDMFFCSMPHKADVFMNGKLWKKLEHYKEPRQMTTGSDILNHVDLGVFSGKLRIFGSGILHMAAPFAFSNIDSCLTTKCYAWDAAAPHALALKLGLEVSYMDGAPIVYDDALLIERRRFQKPILVGNHACLEYMERTFKLL